MSPAAMNTALRDVLTSPAALVLPGASLMELTPVAGGVRVYCSGCCAECIVPFGSDPAVFVHADTCCPIHRVIERAFEEFAAGTTECIG